MRRDLAVEVAQDIGGRLPTAAEAFAAGYAKRPDRDAVFPWNVKKKIFYDDQLPLDVRLDAMEHYPSFALSVDANQATFVREADDSFPCRSAVPETHSPHHEHSGPLQTARLTTADSMSPPCTMSSTARGLRQTSAPRPGTDEARARTREPLCRRAEGRAAPCHFFYPGRDFCEEYQIARLLTHSVSSTRGHRNLKSPRQWPGPT